MKLLTLTEEKECTKCGVPKYLNEFHKMAQSRDGHRPDCKECHLKDQKVYQELHSDQEAARSATHYAVNREDRLEYQQAYAIAHHEQIVAYKKNNLSAHAERQRLRESNKQHVFDEHVDRMTVFQRDEGICGICNKEASVDDFHVDHVVPLSKGGRHNYSNVQTAHPSCNCKKKDRLNFVLEEVK